MTTDGTTAMTTAAPEFVLVVDDEAPVRQMLTRALWSAGFQCVAAESAAAALAELRDGRFAVMLSDIRMPGMDGLELLPLALQHDPDLVVIMVTALAGLDTALAAIRAGAFDYVTKPFQLAEVELTVRRALEHRRLRRENRRYTQHLERLVEERTWQVRQATIDVVTSLGLVLEAKDEWTHDHSRRVAQLAGAIGEGLGLSTDACRELRLAGLLHDIGKIGIREAVLHKDGPLTPEEYGHIKLHPELGARILAPLQDLRPLVPAIRHHHEHWDGQGYPDRLAGEDIPFSARIMAVADAYVAMRERRPYRLPMPKIRALSEIRLNARRQFDLHVVGALLQLDNRGVLDEIDLAYPEDPPELMDLFRIGDALPWTAGRWP